ncbi:hypothetical protein [Anaerosinus massiliensis]|uniref:hypothetical protein n=1 Tax=Massilibacillus massiliensis TaxID=1806837 RepID=UPI000DA5F188|nr:hypothetical protein [Massilibacillus massiliensis]
MKYTENQLENIAEACSEFEHIITAMGYGTSLLNISPDDYKRRCNDCINWYDGSCEIFTKENSLNQYSKLNKN